MNRDQLYRNYLNYCEYADEETELQSWDDFQADYYDYRYHMMKDEELI